MQHCRARAHGTRSQHHADGRDLPAQSKEVTRAGASDGITVFVPTATEIFPGNSNGKTVVISPRKNVIIRDPYSSTVWWGNRIQLLAGCPNFRRCAASTTLRWWTQMTSRIRNCAIPVQNSV